MNKNKIAENTLSSNPTWKGVYRVGGISALIIGPLWILGAVLSVVIGPPPGATEDYLRALAGHITLSQINFGIFTLTDFLLIPVVLALYLALKQISKSTVLIAAGLLMIYIFVDLAVTEMNSIALVTLAQQYIAATTDAQRAGYMAAAYFALATLPLATFISYGVSSIGYLIISIVMLKGVFRKLSAYLGIILSIMGIVGSFYVILPGLAVFLGPCLIAFGVWCVLIGVQLLRLGRVQGAVKTAVAEIM